MKRLCAATPVVSICAASLLVLFGLATPLLAAGPPVPHGDVEVDVLTEGSAISQPNGMYFDTQGRLVIASFLGTGLIFMDPEDGTVLDELDRDNETPDDVTVGPDGSIYWTSPLTGIVSRLELGGQITSQYIAPVPNPITFNDEGRLFVSECAAFGGSGLYEVDPELQDPPRFISSDLGVLCGVNGMDFGPDGFLYGPRMFQNDVARIDPETGVFTIVASGFVVPVALKFDSQGRLFVLDSATGEVWQVDSTSGLRSLVAQFAPGLDNLAIDDEDRLFVSDAVGGYVYRIHHDGSVHVVSQGGLMPPGAVAAVAGPGGKDSVWIGTPTQMRRVSGLNGKTQDEILILPGTAFVPPLSAAVDGSNLLVTAWLANAVQVWDPSIPAVVAQIFDFSVPTNAIRWNGDFVVAELGTGTVTRADGGDPSQRETLANGLFVPLGLAAHGDDVWVSDWASGVVWQIVDGGLTLATPVPVAVGLAGPEGLAYGPDGGLLVVEVGTQSLKHIDLGTGQVDTLVSNLAVGEPPLPGLIPYGWFSQVAVGPSGAIYVTGDVDRVVYKVRIEED